VLLPETEQFLTQLEWPGNVRQLENICRWLTVMASGREVHLNDLPPELLQRQAAPSAADNEWRESLRRWADQQLALGRHDLLATAVPQFERIMIKAALRHTHGRRRDAAQLLGWGRNTLTRKVRELGLGDDDADSDDDS
jgi:two-component system nitrogen regulation response regulator GlnG